MPNNNAAFLIKIIDLTPDKEDEMPVTWVYNPVSKMKEVLCRFGENRWNIAPLFGISNLAPSAMILNFEIFPEPQRRLWKRYIYGLMLRGQSEAAKCGRDQGIAASTLMHKFNVFVDFVKPWMHRQGLESILELTDSGRSRRECAQLLDNYIAEANCASRIELARARLAVLDDLFQLTISGYMKGGFSNPVIIPGKPDNYINTKLKSKAAANKGKPATPIVRDIFANKIAEAIRRQLDGAKNVWCAWQEVRSMISYNIEYFNCSGRSKTMVEKRRDIHLRPFGFESPREVYLAAFKLYYSCLVAAGFYTGLRENEIIDIEINGLDKKVDSRGYIHYYVTTVIRKTSRSKRGEIHRRPVAKAAYDAITAAIELTKPVRKDMLTYIDDLKTRLFNLEKGTKEFTLVLGALSEAEKQKNKVFLSLRGRTKHIDTVPVLGVTQSLGAKYGVLTDVTCRLNKFLRAHNIRDPNINGGGYPRLTYHIMRRTLARYIAKYIRNDPYIVKWLYGHKGAFMSELYMQPDPDNEFFDLIEEQIFIQNADLLEEQILSKKPLAGQIGKKLIKIREQLTSRSARELAENMAKGSLLVFNGHSWCFAENGQDLCDFSQCVMQPTKCADCPKTFINDVLLPIWQAIHDNTEKIIEFMDDPLVKRQHRKAVEKALETIDILKGRVIDEELLS